jgi:ribosomal protein S27AE
MFAETKTATDQRKYCPKCGHPDVMRIPRNWRDHLQAALLRQPLKRYRCGRCRSEHTLASAQESD